MFVGHLAVALAAKRQAPLVSLGWLVAAVMALDLIWPVLLLAGIEHVRIEPGATAFTPFVFTSYPWSHSLAMAVGWGIALGAIARWRGVPAAACALVAALVVSHWVLDWASHAPDMPLWPSASSPRYGLGLWRSIPLTFVVEGTLWLAAVVLYLRGRAATRQVRPVAFWSFVLVTTCIWMAGPFSPPPPDVRSLAWFGLVGWITVPWAAAADRRR